MNEKEILKNLMRNPAFRNAMKELLLHDDDLARNVVKVHVVQPKTTHVWCAELETVDGEKYYHPIIVPKGCTGGFMAPTLDYLMDVDNYTMMSSENQFEAYEYEHMAKMLERFHNNVRVMLVAIPSSTFTRLKSALNNLVATVLVEAEQCFGHLDNIARLTHTNADMMKTQFVSSIFANMSVLSCCIDNELHVSNSENHDYVLDLDAEEDDECTWHEDDEDDYDD